MLKRFLLPLSHSEDTLSLQPAVPKPSSKSQYMSTATVLAWRWTEVPGVSDSSCKKHWYSHPLSTEVQSLNDHKAICPETGSSLDSIAPRKCCVYERLSPGSKESTLTKFCLLGHTTYCFAQFTDRLDRLRTKFSTCILCYSDLKICQNWQKNKQINNYRNYSNNTEKLIFLHFIVYGRQIRARHKVGVSLDKHVQKLTLLWYHENSYVNSTMGSIWPHCKKP